MILPLFLSLKQSKQKLPKWKNQFAINYQKNLLSSRAIFYSSKTKQQPVIIAVHGFGSSPFETQELKTYIEQHSTAHVSSIYLGEHSNISAFQSSKWTDWLKPIIDEYNHLVNLGFEHIILCGCSTGATLILQGLHLKLFPSSGVIKDIILIDSLVKSRSPILTLMPFLAPFIYAQQLNLNNQEQQHWLPFRPTTSLTELAYLIKNTQQILEKGIQFSSNITISLFQSSNDPVIDPSSMMLIFNGLTKKTACNISKHMIQSYLHVCSRLKGRDTITKQDKDNQEFIFNYILNKCIK